MPFAELVYNGLVLFFFHSFNVIGYICPENLQDILIGVEGLDNTIFKELMLSLNSLVPLQIHHVTLMPSASCYSLRLLSASLCRHNLIVSTEPMNTVFQLLITSP
jgi:hypothetical protein